MPAYQGFGGHLIYFTGIFLLKLIALRLFFQAVTCICVILSL